MPRLSDVPVRSLPTERFGDVLDPAGYAALLAVRERADRLLGGSAVWCVNSTAHGGGVAEMLRSLLAYARGAGIDARWSVLSADPAFFAITKRLHNRLHGAPGDGGPLGADEHAHYEAVTAASAEALLARLGPDDAVILHDPQTAGMAPRLARAGVPVVWRLHVGADRDCDLARAARAFLLPYVRAADRYVVSRPRFAWPELDPGHAVVVMPSIDPFSPKNQILADDAVDAILRVAGLVEGPVAAEPAFRREDGTAARVHRAATVVQDAPIARDGRFVAQVSRWDRLKDPVGVLHGFASAADAWGDAHLVLAGPRAGAVADDPEAETTLAEVVAARSSLPASLRARTHLATLPVEDEDENAAIVNAIQRRAAVVVQKSLAEGFGLTVTEAMWKGKPLVVSHVGGIQDQIADGEDGLAIDPRDLDAFGAAVGGLLGDPGRAARLGAAARDRVRSRFLQPRQLAQWVEILGALRERPAQPSAASTSRS